MKSVATKYTVTTRDRTKITELLNDPQVCNHASADAQRLLRDRLQRAASVEASQVSGELVSMNSPFYLQDQTTGEVIKQWLCYPDAAGYSANDLSILSPLGAQVLGCRVGDEIVVDDANGRRRRFTVLRVLA
ncbi:nucleoside diphosphate kinase regulator [Rhodopirellula maiorica SM1]|uniref:Nucleoside diphosphate kinase regulator n=1 Tax=Rhodopirellula maiorica SM1 TaxID=1265738 RepID=M5RJZ3_9BACT|nr:GreA/GreB family elongation factor [Rhodopirellula maiorica]EMI19516.1 nucleoside diphosphate kinase regulator [Rhodopirellula maiorica SM1]